MSGVVWSADRMKGCPGATVVMHGVEGMSYRPMEERTDYSPSILAWTSSRTAMRAAATLSWSS
jgi:hypothetical protein